MFTSMKSRVLGGSALAATLAVALGVNQAPAPDDETAATEQEQVIGIYNPEAAFQQYHGIQELIALSQRVQQEAQQAQAEGDQQRLMQLQQQMQQERMRVINQFQEDVRRVAPDVAQEQGLQLVAVEVAYVAEEFGEPKDITQEMVDKINEDAPEQEQPAGSTPGGPAPQ